MFNIFAVIKCSIKIKNFIMKIAITSQGSQLDSIIDQRFGRCSFFVIYDTEKQTSEFIQNPNKSIEEGAGPARRRHDGHAVRWREAS